MALVRERMEARGVSAYRLSKLTGLPQSSLSRWLNAQSAITVDDLHVLAVALDADAGVWLTRVQGSVQLDKPAPDTP